MLRDLLGEDPSQKLEIRKGPSGLFVPGLTEKEVKTVEDVNEVGVIIFSIFHAFKVRFLLKVYGKWLTFLSLSQAAAPSLNQAKISCFKALS